MSLTATYWFHNVCFIPLLGKLSMELFMVLWQNPCFRRKIVFTCKELRHPFEIFCKPAFQSKCCHTRIMINSLEWLHFGQIFRINSTIIAPIEIPFTTFTLVGLKIKHLTCFLNHLIPSMFAAKYNLLQHKTINRGPFLH